MDKEEGGQRKGWCSTKALRSSIDSSIRKNLNEKESEHLADGEESVILDEKKYMRLKLRREKNMSYERSEGER